jgi:flagella basal body P-ring formation protein FlgA
MTQVSFGSAAKGVKPTAPTAGRLSAAQRRVKQVVLSYLRAANPDARRAAMEVTCDEACATAASAMTSTISVVAAEPAGSSEYDVIVAINSKGQVEEFTVKATVAESSRVVVAARTLRAGAILTAADLKLASPKSDAELSVAVGDVEELIGRELTRAVGMDQIVPIDQIVQPRLIRKGELVDVTAKSGGVRVTTQAVAQEDGSLGQSISLEPVDPKAKVGQKNKETIRAQVVASGQAQIEIAGRTLPSNRIGAEPVRLRPSTGRISSR